MMVQTDSLSFAQVAAQLDSLLKRLLQASPHDPANHLPRTGGVYLFTEEGRHLYVGQTRNFQARYRGHLSGKENQSHFAYNLAMESCADAQVAVTGTRQQI